MKTAIVHFSGFREGEYAPTGSRELNNILFSEFNSSARVFRVSPWDENVKHAAKALKRDGYERVIVIGYSWGVGYAATRFCKYALKNDVSIPLVLTCDGVYRPTYLPSWGLFNILSCRALTRHAKIVFPKEVGKIVGVRQENEAPKGHKIIHGDTGVSLTLLTTTHKHDKITHRTIDSDPFWYEAVLREINHIL